MRLRLETKTKTKIKTKTNQTETETKTREGERICSCRCRSLPFVLRPSSFVMAFWCFVLVLGHLTFFPLTLPSIPMHCAIPYHSIPTILSPLHKKGLFQRRSPRKSSMWTHRTSAWRRRRQRRRRSRRQRRRRRRRRECCAGQSLHACWLGRWEMGEDNCRL